jgi:hypothetical protein
MDYQSILHLESLATQQRFTALYSIWNGQAVFNPW